MLFKTHFPITKSPETTAVTHPEINFHMPSLRPNVTTAEFIVCYCVRVLYAEISASLVERRQTIYVAIGRWTPYDTLSENTTRNFSVVFDSTHKKIVYRSANHKMKYLSFFVLLLSLQDHSKGRYFDETKLLQSAK